MHKYIVGFCGGKSPSFLPEFGWHTFKNKVVILNKCGKNGGIQPLRGYKITKYTLKKVVLTSTTTVCMVLIEIWSLKIKNFFAC